MTGLCYSEGYPKVDMVLRNYDITPHHFIPNAHKTATLKWNEPVDFNFKSESITVKDPCVGCPWNQNVLFNGKQIYVGDTPCQWCEHGTKLTCTSTTPLNPDHIETTSGLLNNTTLMTSNMIDECYEEDYFDFDDLTDDEIKAMAEEEAKYYNNIFSKLMTKRGIDDNE